MTRFILLACALLASSLVQAQADRDERIKALLPQIDKIYADVAANEHIPGVVYGIVVDGKLIHSRAIGVANVEQQTLVANDTEFRIASMTKSFVAMATLKLRDQGKLGLDDPVSKYLPEVAKVKLPTTDSPPLTIRNLLTMTTGLPEDNPWGDRQMHLDNAAIAHLVGGGLSFSNAPGVGFEYSNLGFVMLGKVVTKAAGMRFQDYITKEILLPLGMKNTRWEYAKAAPGKLALGYQWVHDKWELEPMLHDGDAAAMGGLITTMDDFARYVAFHLDAWPARSDPETGPLRRASVREMQQPRVFTGMMAKAMTADEKTPNPKVGFYAYGLTWSRDSRNTVTVGHSGGLPGFGSQYRFAPQYGIGVIAFSNLRYGPIYQPTSKVLDLLLEQGAMAPKPVAVSAILAKRQAQVAQLIQHWDEALGKEITAENFFLDRTREDWIAEAKQKLEPNGKVILVGPMKAENQLRGKFPLIGEKGMVNVFFTLSPENDPKVQFLELKK